MAAGIWTLTDDGEFVLDETYAAVLKEARGKAAIAGTTAIVEALEDKCPYSTYEILQALLDRCSTSDESPNEIVDSFVLEALSGDL